MAELGSVVHTIERDEPPAALAFSGDGAIVVVGGGGLVEAHDLTTRQPLFRAPRIGFVSGVAVGAAGVAVADLDHVVLLTFAGTTAWDVTMRSGESANQVAFSPDGRSVIAATDARVTIRDTATGAEVREIEVDPTIAGFDLSRDGGRLVVAVDHRHGGNHHNAGSARVLDLATGTQVSRHTPDHAVFSAAFSVDGASVLCGSADGATRLFEAGTGAEVWRIEFPARVIAVDPTGHWAVLGADAAARVIDLDGVEKTRMEHDGAVMHVAFSPSGRSAASAGIDAVVHVVDIRTGRDRYTLTDTGEVQAMAFSPDNRWLAVGDGNVSLVDNGVPR